MLLCTLGGLELKDSSFQRPKTLLLLAYLAVEGTKERQHLSTLLWPDATAKERLHRLRVMLSQLRKEASGVIEVDKGQIWTVLDIDAKTFLAAFEAGRYEEALKYYSGPFLQGFQQSDWSVELEEWVYGTREFLAARAREAFLRLGEAEAAKGCFDTAAKQAEAAYVLAGAAEIEPEDLVRCHMLLAAGNHPRATEVRREAQDFGMTLDLTLEEAREQLYQAEDTVEASSRTHNLPLRNTSFISRDAELIEIAELLSQPNRQLLTLCGPGGVGKTRLAVHAALEQYQLGRFSDGVFFVALESLASVQAIPTAIASAMGLELQSYLDPLTQLQEHLAKKDTLLILDNYEHLLEAALLPSQLLQASAKLRLLVTSRERLNLEEEWVLEVEGLAIPPEDATSFEDIASFASVQLFSRRAKRARRDFTLSQENALDVARICRLTQGFPLALELAATWMKHLSCQVIAEELGKSLDFLNATTRNLPERHKSMRAVFEHSWRLLNHNEQQLLRKLSVFRGGFRHEAAAEVTGATISSLASLVDKSLLRLSPSGRYDRHPLLYQYTEEKLAEHPEEQYQTQEAHMSYYLNPRFKTPASVADNISTTLPELENISAAWLWAAAQHHEEELLLMTHRMQYLYRLSDRLYEGIDVLSEGLEFLDKTNPVHHSSIGRILASLGTLFYRIGNSSKALETAWQCTNLLDGSDKFYDLVSLWIASSHITAAALQHGTWDVAIHHYKVSLRYAKRIAALDEKWKKGIVGSQVHLAFAHKCQGNYVLAQNLLQEAINSGRQEDEMLPFALSELATLMLNTSRSKEAKGLFEKALTLIEALGLQQDRKDNLDKANMLSYLALTHCELGEYAAAKACAENAVRLLKSTKVNTERLYSSVNLGRVLTFLGAYSEAWSYLSEGLTLAYRSHDISFSLQALIAFAEWQVRQGFSEFAIPLLAFTAEHPNACHPDRELARKLLTGCRKALPPKVFEAAFKRGKAMKLEEAVELVLQAKA